MIKEFEATCENKGTNKWMTIGMDPELLFRDATFPTNKRQRITYDSGTPMKLFQTNFNFYERVLVGFR